MHFISILLQLPDPTKAMEIAATIANQLNESALIQEAHITLTGGRVVSGLVGSLIAGFVLTVGVRNRHRIKTRSNPDGDIRKI